MEFTREQVKEILSEAVQKLNKAVRQPGGMKPGHKYIRRTGTPGKYVYWYKDPSGRIYAGEDPHKGRRGFQAKPQAGQKQAKPQDQAKEKTAAKPEEKTSSKPEAKPDTVKQKAGEEEDNTKVGYGMATTYKDKDGKEYYKGPLKIDKSSTLSPANSKIEARFATLIQGHLEKAVKKYRDKPANFENGVLVINADNARDLSPDYHPEDPDARRKAQALLAPAVHEPSSAIVKYMMTQRLDEPVNVAGGKRKMVVIMAGGGGSGKTRAQQHVPHVQAAAHEAHMVWDTTLSALPSALKNIDYILSKGFAVTIPAVYRDVEGAFNGVIDRAGVDKPEWRTVPIDAFIAAHLGIKETLPKLIEHYAHNPLVTFKFLDNTAKDVGGIKEGGVEMFAKEQYNKDVLKTKLMGMLDSAYEKGKINEYVYEGIAGKPPAKKQQSKE